MSTELSRSGADIGLDCGAGILAMPAARIWPSSRRRSPVDMHLGGRVLGPDWASLIRPFAIGFDCAIGNGETKIGKLDQRVTVILRACEKKFVGRAHMVVLASLSFDRDLTGAGDHATWRFSSCS